MDYDISNMTTGEIKETITGLCDEVDTEIDIYFLFLMDELELRLPEKNFTDFRELYKNQNIPKVEVKENG
jgi:hypothetical protein